MRIKGNDSPQTQGKSTDLAQGWGLGARRWGREVITRLFFSEKGMIPKRTGMKEALCPCI